MAVDLRKMVIAAKPSIAVIGLGGAGCNIITWISHKGMAGGKIIAANTDFNHLATIRKADKLILLGKKLCKGYGCGGSLEMGAEATRENLTEIKAAGVARELGILTIACITIPFRLEKARREKAREVIKALTESCDSTIVIDNNKLSEFAGDLPMNDALSVANALVADFVRNITETITQTTLVNLDFADLRTVMEQGGICAIGLGEGEGEDMTLEEVAVAGEHILDKVPNIQRVIWGARVDNSLTGRVRIMAVLTGIKSPSVKGSENGITNRYPPLIIPA